MHRILAQQNRSVRGDSVQTNCDPTVIPAMYYMAYSSWAKNPGGPGDSLAITVESLVNTGEHCMISLRARARN